MEAVLYVCSVSEWRETGKTEEETESEREKEAEKETEREVSSFRFTVVVGEIWLCSYSTLRTEPEEE